MTPTKVNGFVKSPSKSHRFSEKWHKMNCLEIFLIFFIKVGIGLIIIVLVLAPISSKCPDDFGDTLYRRHWIFATSIYAKIPIFARSYFHLNFYLVKDRLSVFRDALSVGEIALLTVSPFAKIECALFCVRTYLALLLQIMNKICSAALCFSLERGRKKKLSLTCH